MTHESTHLSEEALNDVLIGMGSIQSELHLASCPACRAKIEAFRSDMGLFNETSLAWIESESSAAPRPAVRHPKPRRLAFLSIGWAAAAALLIATAVPLWREMDHSLKSHASFSQGGAPPAARTEDSEAQITQDNELMEAVNAAINPNEASTLNGYDLLEGAHPRRTARAK